ncbi:DUF262 domain-containing protein [Helicobacter suis]|uniref:DUF262 domain-containing protein n=1 Tax=Helicobacter suis TaxID=104628 RepID=UPI0013D68E39|nr:DUF262 domain-containing protein [Helicobacter suis]
MKNNSLCTVGGLKDLIFKIPSYQRGYRWTKIEVKILLKDITDFIKEKAGEYYSLQPLVVKKNEEVEGKEVWNVIDGQQRLTTLFLIVKYLDGSDLFTIEYETRKKSFEFLQEQNIKKESQQDKGLDIDFYHFKETYKTIENFFKDKQDNQKKEFYETLLNECKVLWHESQDEEKEVFRRLNSGKIPLLEAEKIKALFLAKTEQTEEEDEIKERAGEWYEAEKKARDNNDFIYCVLEHVSKEHIMEEMQVLSDDIQRIEVYLKAIVHKDSEDYLFDHFYKCYKNKKIQAEWGKLEEAIATLSGFASRGEEPVDRKIFHYLGFLIQEGSHIHDLYQEWLEVREKDKFADYLFKQVKKSIGYYVKLKGEGVRGKDKRKEIDELTFDEDKEALQALLLLFNLEYLVRDQSSNAYFEFNRFVLEQWSLEHVYAQKSESVVSEKELRILAELRKFTKRRKSKKEDENIKKESIEKIAIQLKELIKSKEGRVSNELKKEIKEFLEKLKKTEEKDLFSLFRSLFLKIEKELVQKTKGWLEQVQKHLEDKDKPLKAEIEGSLNKKDQDFFHIIETQRLLKRIDEAYTGDDSLHTLQNLTLLDKRSNSAIGNLIFNKKQQKIQELDDQKRLIPICTREVFKKVFSRSGNRGDHIFTKEDQEDYLNEIVKYLEEYGITVQEG